MTLMGIAHIVEHIDVVVRSWLRCDQILATVHIQTNQIAARVVGRSSVDAKWPAVERNDSSKTCNTVEKPDGNTRPDEHIPLSGSKQLDMVVHGP